MSARSGDTMACINMQAVVAIMPWTSMMAGTPTASVRPVFGAVRAVARPLTARPRRRPAVSPRQKDHRERLPALTKPRAPGAEVVPPCAAGFRAGRAAPPGPLFGAECDGGAGAGSPAGRAERAGDRDQQAGQGEQDELPRLVHRQQ